MTYLDIEALIVARLVAMVPTVPAANVLTYADMASLQEAQQPVPGINVLFGGQQPRHPPAGAMSQVIDQTWIVVPVIRHVGNITSGQAAREMMSPILAAVDAAMIGWEPTIEHDAMQLVSAQQPTYRNGFLNYPLAYRTSFTARGTRQ